ncbi:heme o synthase [Patescibacteria group bacterium]|nr:heme o synthase [Patescibacteria group bacterium]
MSRVKAYYIMVKPGIIYGNLITAVAGYLLASKLRINAGSFIGMLFGTSLVIGGACVFNNLYDRDIDQVMKRTKERPTVNGRITARSGIIYGIFLTIIGFCLLAVLVNWLCVVIGAVGFLDYALIYSYFKRRTYHATLIGSISGATPIVGGYVAYAGHLDLAALIIGLMMLFWQMPHFYAIALFRAKEYKKAKVPILPLIKGRLATVEAIVIYSVLFVLAVISLYFIASLHVYYLLLVGLAAVIWTMFNLSGINVKEIELWAKRSFRYSLVVMLLMSVGVALR